MAHYVGTSREAEKARRLQEEREKKRKEFEERIRKIKEENQEGLKRIDDAFQAHDSRAFDAFRASTVGLQTLEDFRQKRMLLDENEKRALEKKEAAARALRAKKEEERKRKLQALSFSIDEEGEEEVAPSKSASSGEGAGKKRKAEEDGKEQADKKEEEGSSSNSNSNGEQQQKKKRKKDPTADTSFLPDEERERQARELRKQLEEEYMKEQERIKQELIEVTYSYWDGTGHRRTIKVPKGTRIDQFLEKCRKELSEQFHELRGMNAENLMYIKEDLIIPHHYTFYDLIVTKARGKSGPLFHFDVHDDVRLVQDVRIEKDESHAGKIVTRAWYERNKHIFPASRWEVYDPSVKYDKYTIR